MKKLIVMLAAGVLFAGTATAQSWTDLLKKAATEVVDKATDGKATQYAMTGTWKYKEPAVRFESDDVTAYLAGAAVESTAVSKLQKAYDFAGIKAGSCIFTFNSDGTFTATVGSRNLSGEYTYTAETHAITLTLSKGILGLKTLQGNAYISGSELELVFPMTKLVEFVSKLGSKISSLASISAMLEKYKNVYLGFAFEK